MDIIRLGIFISSGQKEFAEEREYLGEGFY